MRLIHEYKNIKNSCLSRMKRSEPSALAFELEEDTSTMARMIDVWQTMGKYRYVISNCVHIKGLAWKIVLDLARKQFSHEKNARDALVQGDIE